MLVNTRSTAASTTWRAIICRNTTLQPYNHFQKRLISIQKLDADKGQRDRVVVLGSGWAGYTLSRELDAGKFQVVTISPRSYFVFTPLLAGTSTGTLEFRTAIEPVRSRRTKGEFFQGWADIVDFDRRTLTVERATENPEPGRSLTQDSSINSPGLSSPPKGDQFEMKWDKLVIAVGCYNQTFNTKGVKEHAYFLKDAADARRIRNRLLTCFETAALPTTPLEIKKELLNFAVVGGGPTGIEWSAELHDVVNEEMRRIYPDLIEHVRITVYDVAPTILNMFDKKLARYAMDTFRREGISIKTQHHVEELRLGGPSSSKSSARSPENGQPLRFTIRLREEGEIGIGMCVWSTGLMMNPFVAKGLEGKVKRHNRTGGVAINERLQAMREDGEVIPDVFALGDCAAMDSTSYPATAQVANQEAAWLAKRLNKGDIAKQQFTYKNLGVMAYLGNWNAILHSQGGDISGRAAWLIWRGAYLAKSVSWRNRILIPVYWFINWVFGRDMSRF